MPRARLKKPDQPTPSTQNMRASVHEAIIIDGIQQRGKAGGPDDHVSGRRPPVRRSRGGDIDQARRTQPICDR